MSEILRTFRTLRNTNLICASCAETTGGSLFAGVSLSAFTTGS